MAPFNAPALVPIFAFRTWIQRQYVVSEYMTGERRERRERLTAGLLVTPFGVGAGLTLFGFEAWIQCQIFITAIRLEESQVFVLKSRERVSLQVNEIVMRIAKAHRRNKHR